MKLSFTSDKIQLIFCNANETYYGAGLFEMNTNQMLWLQLHEIGFEGVYFISSCPSGVLISDYGDKNRKNFVKTGLIGGKVKVTDDLETKGINTPSAKDFKTVFLPEYDKCKSALVCSIDDLNNICKSNDWRESFWEFANNSDGKATLFLLVTLESENKLKTENIAGLLKETEIGDLLDKSKDYSEESIRNLLFANHVKNCNFIDFIDKDDISNILRMLMIQDPAKANSLGLFEYMNEYLRVILDAEAPLDRNLCLKSRVRNRADCYMFFSNMRNWNNLVTYCQLVDFKRVFLKGSFNQSLRDHVLDTEESIGSIIDEIKNMLQNTNKLNDQHYGIMFCAMDLYQELEAYSKDYDSQGCIFDAIRSYIRFLQIDEVGLLNMKELYSLLNGYKGIFQLSKSIDSKEQQLDSQTNSTKPLTFKMTNQIKAQLETETKKMIQMKDYVNAKMLMVLNNALAVDVDLFQDISKTVDDIRASSVVVNIDNSIDDYDYNLDEVPD